MSVCVGACLGVGDCHSDRLEVLAVSCPATKVSGVVMVEPGAKGGFVVCKGFVNKDLMLGIPLPMTVLILLGGDQPKPWVVF